MNDLFNFHVPITITKAGENGKEMMLAGIASTADYDREGESLLPEGFDYSYLKNHGYINWHHQLAKNPEAVIGEPTKVEVQKGKGLYIEGKLYEDSDMAKKAYALANVLNKNSSTRKLGWSVEGKVTERDPANPKKVLKAKITGVALTPMPINPKTIVTVLKAMSDDYSEISEVVEAEGSEGNGGNEKVINFNGQEIKIKKGETEDELVITVKALTTQSGAPVTVESVEGGTKPDSGFTAKKTGEENLEGKKDAVHKGMDRDEAYEYVFANNPDISIEDAKKAVEYAFAKK